MREKDFTKAARLVWRWATPRSRQILANRLRMPNPEVAMLLGNDVKPETVTAPFSPKATARMITRP